MAVLVVLFASSPVFACTNILVGRDASADGSTFLICSCDGGIYAAVRVEPAANHLEETIQLYAEPVWGSSNSVSPAAIGAIPQVTRTHKCIDMLAGPTFMHIGGINEHGVSIGETTLHGVRSALTNTRGLLSPF